MPSLELFASSSIGEVNRDFVPQLVPFVFYVYSK